MAVLSFCLVSPALASDEGLPLGQLIAKPSLTVDVLYDSNVFSTQRNPEADFGLQAVPAIELVYPGDNFRWEFLAKYRFFTYFNVAERNHDVLRDPTSFELGTTFDINREGKFGFWFSPYFKNRRITRGGEDLDSWGSATGSQMSIGTPLEFKIRPTSAFQIGIDGRWDYTRAYFSEAAFDSDPLRLGNMHDVGGGLSLDWRFFPRTHLQIEGGAGHIFQGPVDAGTITHDAPVENTYWRALAGMRGDVTRKLSLMGMIGYGGAYLDDVDDTEKNLKGLDGLIGRAEVALRPILTQRFALGFNRDFYFLYYAYWILDTQVYFKYKGLIADRLAITADVAYIYRDLEGSETDVNAAGDPFTDGIPRTEHQVSAGVSAEVMIARWFSVGAKYRFSSVPSSSNNVGEFIDNRVTISIILGYR